VAFIDKTVRAILLDVEGTTTALDFVYRVLFPYARSHLRRFLDRYSSLPDVQADIAMLYQENLADLRQSLRPPMLRNSAQDSGMESLAAYVEWLMQQDRKSTALKSLQGKIWKQGYESGELRSQVFEDVLPALKRWHHSEKSISIFSSGSVLAQMLLFAHTTAGDLTPYISRYFDTTTGAKTASASYCEIARALKRLPSEVLFISDVVAELDTAGSAGFEILLCERPGNRAQPAASYRVIRSLGEVFP